jgi:hypothetical protein
VASVITHSLMMAVVDSHAMVGKQSRWLAKILPPTWELILIDDDSAEPIGLPDQQPRETTLMPYRSNRKPGEWTQKEAINAGAELARGRYLVKSDIDHIFTPEALRAVERFGGDMLLFERHAGRLRDDLTVEPLKIHVSSPVDDVWAMRLDLFRSRGGYPQPYLRRYGAGGSCFWDLSRKPDAQPHPGAPIYVTPSDFESYHSLARVRS